MERIEAIVDMVSREDDARIPHSEAVNTVGTVIAMVHIG